MKIAVVGLGHLANATAEGCREHGFEMVTTAFAELVWFCDDMPVDADDRCDVAKVENHLAQTLEKTVPGVPVLISTQIPVGTMAAWQARWPEHHLAYQPENIRKAHAVEDFRHQTRMILGTDHEEDVNIVSWVLRCFTEAVIVMSPSSAEAVKHVLNSFLALEIVFANEAADVCEKVGADIEDVFRGFRSDVRVGDGPLRPGGPFAGGTLGRDLRVLLDVIGNAGGYDLLRAIAISNAARL